MNIIDYSFWLEYFAGTDAGNTVAKIIENTNDSIIPSFKLIILLCFMCARNCTEIT
jgi:hypothetical protein